MSAACVHGGITSTCFVCAQARCDQAMQVRGNQDVMSYRQQAQVAQHDVVSGQRFRVVEAARDAAWKRVAELEASLAHSRECTADRQAWVEKSERDRNRLSDEAGALRTELRDVKAELADALRKVERLERKGCKR